MNVARHPDPAVRILRLSLAGFGVYERPVHFEFSPAQNIMVAPNETGKSTLLHGLAAVWFGLPSESNPSRFGSARFRSFSRPPEFWGEIEWECAGRAFLLHRSFETHRVRLTELKSSGKDVLFEGEHNPRATSSAGSAFRALLQEHLGISDLDLFLQTFCMSQPLPDETGIGAELQHLLSGSRAGRVDDVLHSLFQQVKDLTKGTGDLGLVRPGVTRPQNQKEPGRIESLEAELEKMRRELGDGRQVLERLNSQNEKLEETQQEIIETRESLDLAKRRAQTLRRWLDLNEERRARQAAMQHAQKAIEELTAAEQERETHATGLRGRFARFSDAGPDLARALEALEKAEIERERTEQMLSETEAEALRLDEEARALKTRLAEEFGAVQGRPGLLALHRQAEQAAKRREERALALSKSSGLLEEAIQRLDLLSEWNGVRPDLLRPEVEAILNDAASLESIRDRIAEIDRQSEERRFLSGERLESLERKIELEERHKLLASCLKDIEKEVGFDARLLASLEEERIAKEAEIRLLEERIQREHAAVAGRSDLPSIARRLSLAKVRRKERREQIRAIESEKKVLDDAEAALGDSTDLGDPAAMRREAEDFVRDIASIETIDARLEEIEGQIKGREFLEGERLEQLRQAISCRDRLREISLRGRELELDQIRKRHESADRMEAVHLRPHGPISIWLSLLVGIALAAGVHFGLELDMPISAGLGAGAVAILQILNTLLRRRKRQAASPPAANVGQQASGASDVEVDAEALLKDLRSEQVELEKHIAAASEDLGPFASTTGPELARLEERWELLDAEVERLRRDRATLVERRFGIDGDAEWRTAPASEMRTGTAPLLSIPGAPSEGTISELIEWLRDLDPSTWSKLDEAAHLVEENRQRRAETERELARLIREDEGDTEVEDLTRRLHPLPADLVAEEIERQVAACSVLETRLTALHARLEEIPGADELQRRHDEAEKGLAHLWEGVRDAWPDAPEKPSIEILRMELDRLEAAALMEASDLGPYGRTTRSELARLQERWRIFDEDTARMKSLQREILARRFGVVGREGADAVQSVIDAHAAGDHSSRQAGGPDEAGAIAWESIPAENLPSPFDEVLRLPGAPSGAGASGLVEWMRSLDPDAWMEFQRSASRRRETELERDRLRRDLERMRKEQEEDREFERLTEELAPLAPDTPEETIEALLEGCRKCEHSLHAVQERLKALPTSDAIEQMRREAAKRMEQAWGEIESAWPGARERSSGRELDAWLAEARQEERAARISRQEVAAIDQRLETILRTAGSKSRSALETKRDEAKAVLGQVIMHIQEVEREDPFLAASRDQIDPIERARSLQAETERLEETSDRLATTLKAAEERERELLRGLAKLEGAVPPNVAQMEIRIRHTEEDLSNLRRERDALALAYRWVREAADTFQSAYREDLETRVTEHFRSLTGMAGRRVRLDEEFACRVVDSAGMPLAPEQLSQGARDQLALSIRLAVADLLTQAVPLPLFFDDPFVHYDSGRLKNLRKTLEAVAGERQWLLLTHRSDLAEWADPVSTRHKSASAY